MKHYFQSTCMVGRVCPFIIDSGSSENVGVQKAIDKLGTDTEQHPTPYKLAWLKKVTNLQCNDVP